MEQLMATAKSAFEELHGVPTSPTFSVIDNCFWQLPDDKPYNNRPQNCYLFRDALIRFDVVLEKADGTPPDKNKMVGPIADPVGGLIDSMFLTLNGTRVTLGSSYFQYKSYLTSLINSGGKTTHLQSSGFALDAPLNSNVEDNKSFEARNLLFRKGHSVTGEYKTDAVTLIGKLSKFDDVTLIRKLRIKEFFH
ncbi:hypothetical protein M569_10165 [Genlisea aurea]|uniref:Uncharacterized protein n=1 Tax=Genlisea aurea TaxID=192259 RepID=S8CCC9_9LAMI|nr:hypothetical protein M569_10165 [Genlisea aurea]